MINIEHAAKYCRDDISKIENYDKAIADTTQTWICHHRLGLVHSSKELERLGLYENRPADELIFVTPSEHRRLHNMHMSDETKKKIADAMKGKSHGPMSDEAKQKIAESLKGHTHSDATRKKMSESRKGKPSPRKGKPHPHSDETKMKIAEAQKASWARRKAKSV